MDMKRNRLTLAFMVAMIALCGLLPTVAMAIPRLGAAVIVRLDGEATYTSPSGDGAIEEGMAFMQGQKLQTAENGKIVSVLTPGAVLCVAPETVVDLQQIEMKTEGLPDNQKRIDKDIVLAMPAGGALRFDAGDISPNMTIRVKTAAGEVISSGGRAIVAKDEGEWKVICENAFVTFDQNGKQTTVHQGEILTASPIGGGKFNVKTESVEVVGLEDDFVGCRRAAERLGPVVFDVDYVHVGDLADYIGDRDLAYYGDSKYWSDVSPSTRRSTRKSTRLALPPTGAVDAGRRRRPEVWDWFSDAGVIRGVNFVPSTAVNATEMWQADTFDLDTIGDELGAAKKVGYTSIRVFLPFHVYKADPEEFKERMQDVLGKARKYRMKTVFVLFDDNNQAGKEPYLGKQAEPKPGVHNGQWTPSPGKAYITDKEKWPELEAYVKDLVGSFRRDRRILFWDLYNEPGSFGLGEKSLPLVEAAFGWAREKEPSQPLTTGLWSEMDSRMSKTLMELSDVISFRAYENEEDLKTKLMLCQTLGRPLVCTEFLNRTKGNTFEKILPTFSEQHVGWFNWGLVAGKTQTYLPFDSKAGAKDPEVWQFDMLKEDGDPYDKDEVELIRNFVYAD